MGQTIGHWLVTVGTWLNYAGAKMFSFFVILYLLQAVATFLVAVFFAVRQKNIIAMIKKAWRINYKYKIGIIGAVINAVIGATMVYLFI